ncbi:hypothetical protein ACFFQF_03515 [Haladaptatus pallidirubidus]|uniref:DUF8048 domain-containing protein n=1 Tax=Haladaptatus pallidirubidus TaxID=1008152 RepID=A0AAV3UKM0_9EURY|nr:hypothetical protein [Haladaptatus pallidirubidus]
MVDVPIPADSITDVANRHGVSDDDLTEAVAIYDDLIDGADAIHAHYVSQNNENVSPIVAEDGLVELIFVDSNYWTRMAERLDISKSAGEAAKEVHADYARRLGADECFPPAMRSSCRLTSFPG